MSENVGGDNPAVTWRKPGDPEIANGAPPISQEYLSAFTTSGTVSITNQPASLTVDERQSAVFGVGVDGTPPYYFQWLMDGTPVPGATNSVFTVSAATVADDGTAFSVTVSNLFSAVTSSEAVLKVTPDTTLPTLTAAEGNLNLNKITLTFSEPIRPEDATNTANYALSGGLEVMGASLRLDRRTVVLTTTPQTEGGLHLDRQCYSRPGGSGQ
jgi:hypothetical protein